MKMRSVIPMKTAKTGYIAVSSVLCVLGLLLMIFPGVSVSVLGVLGGILLLVFGGIKLVGYFSRDLYRLAFQYDLAFGVLLILLGGAMLIRPERLMNFICIVFGIAILADGLFKVQMSLEAKRFGLRFWWLILLFAVIAGAAGLLLIFRPGEGSKVLMILFGAALFSEGVLNLCTVITAVKIVKNQKPDTVETEYFDK